MIPSRIMHSLAALSLIAASGAVPIEREEPKAVSAPESPEQRTPKATPPTKVRTPATGAHKRATVAERYRVKLGDTLASIAEDELGDASKWPGLYGTNLKAVGPDPDTLSVDTLLVMREGKAPRIKPAEGNKRDTVTRTDTLDGWITEALDVMAYHGIPGSYNGIFRNVMRESGGNPRAVNNWDSNAAAGIPSKGLLQTIDPTFRAYHVPGTSWDVFDPVANIAAACNYAAAVYGSIDNVHGAY